MSCRGFALLAVLWVVTALVVLTGVAVSTARLGLATTANRVGLSRAAWAREGCVEILLARYAQHPEVRGVDTVDLGRGTWCRAQLENPAAKLNVNVVDREQLAALLVEVRVRPGSVDSLVDALLDWRDPDTIPRPLGEETALNRNGPLADMTELRYVRGFGDSLTRRLSAYLTTRGTGTIDLSAAPRAVLAVVPGMTEESISRLLADREGHGGALTSADELGARLSPAARATLYSSYPEFLRAAAFASPQLIAVVEGGVRGTNLVARVTLTAVPTGTRLAVIRRETE